MRFRLIVDGSAHEIEVDRGKAGPLVRVDGALYPSRLRTLEGVVEVRTGGELHLVEIRGDRVTVDGRPHVVAVSDLDRFEDTSEDSGRALGKVVEVRPPMAGRVIRVAVSQGSTVRRGDTLIVLEAMKMQNEIPAPGDARVRDVRVQEGETIAADRVIAVLEAL